MAELLSLAEAEELPEGRVYFASLNGDMTTVKNWLEGTRLAGHSYKRWVLKDYVALLRVRSLLARGRATMAPSTPEVIVRLFGGRIAAARRPPTHRSRPPPERAAGVPDPVFWKVIEYYRLGDWRHP